MRIVSDNLFRLIKSMSGPEKGYFKKISSKENYESLNKYIVLFDLIDRQTAGKDYDENAVKAGFKNEKFSNNLHVAKGYLYKMILKSLVQFHSERTTSIQINALFNGAMILYKKGLYKESHVQIIKCKNLIRENKADEFLFSVLKLERYLISLINNPGPGINFIENAKELEDAIMKMSNIKEYNELFGKFLIYYKLNQIIRSKSTDEKNSLLNSSYLKNENTALTTESQVLYNKFFYNYHLSLSNDEEIYEYSKRMIQIIEENAFHKNEFLNEYISVLSGYLTSLTFLGNYKEGGKAIAKLKEIDKASFYIEEIIYTIIYNFETIKYIRTGNFKEGLKLIPSIEKKIDEFDEKNKHLKFKFTYSSAYIYFGAGKYEKSIECLNKIFNENQNEIRQDLLTFAHMLNLICHFELNNKDYLFYVIKNTYRVLSKKKSLYKVETAVVNFLRKVPGIVNVKELMPHFIELKDDLNKIIRDPYEKIALDYFDFISWLESKIDGREFAEVIKSKSVS
ncbi:MAG: hypothetical protein ABIY50_08540 [Ignavibacteria bacterium]